MSSYIGRHADLYDIFYADKQYAREAAFVHNCLLEHGEGRMQRLLEIACGTGSHAFVLEKLGYEILATDYSTDMLNQARLKANKTASRVVFQQQDMTSLNIDAPPFDGVVCLFDSIGYVQTNEALKHVLQGVHRNLRKNGLFVFEFWHAVAMLRSYEPVRVRRWKVPEGELLRISETELDYARQLSRIKYSIYELRSDGRYSTLVETQTNRYFLLQEMDGLLTENGFAPLKWFSGFSKDEDITDQTWHVVAVARRNQTNNV